MELEDGKWYYIVQVVDEDIIQDYLMTKGM